MVLAEINYKQELVEIGNNIREYRKKKNFTQEQIAEMADASVNTIHRAENGVNKLPLDTFLAISDALDVPIEKLCPVRFSNATRSDNMKKVEFTFERLTKNNQQIVMETIMPLMNVLLKQQTNG